MKKTQVLLGDEAAALAAIHAGISGSYSYPGTPATEIQEAVQQFTKKEGNVVCKWSPNEKVAMEEALGMSYAGKRVIVSMKHVGLNVAADPFMNAVITGVNGGMVIFIADDPGMHSSQNEQDTRYFADFAQTFCFEPSNQQEIYDFTIEAFEISEKLLIPVVIRLVTRIAHSRANIFVENPRQQNSLSPSENVKQWTLLPGNARVQYKNLVNKQKDLILLSENHPANVEKTVNSKKGIIVSGVAYNYIMENLPDKAGDFNILKINTYPLPVDLINSFIRKNDILTIIEDGYPFIEKKIRGIIPNSSVQIKGKMDGTLPETGELTPDNVRPALGLKSIKNKPPEMEIVIPRPPRLCKGCPHIDMFNIIDEIRRGLPDMRIFGDIGCYTLGALNDPPSIDTAVCMGASVGMAKGAAEGGLEHSVAVIGDSTFTHTGIPTALDAAVRNTPMTLIILDNTVAGMTGGQETHITGENMVTMVKGLGVPEKHAVYLFPHPKEFEKNLNIVKKEIEYKGFSVILAQRNCIQIKPVKLH